MRFAWGQVRISVVVVVVALIGAVIAAPAMAAPQVTYMKGFDAPDTPANLDRIGTLKVGPKKAKNILVLVTGTSASAAYMRPLAQQIVQLVRQRTDHRWQVWAVEGRENLLEDQSVVDQVKRGEAGPQELFDYYLNWITDPSITEHFEFIPDSEVAFAREWGMKVAVKDIRKVVKKAERKSRKGSGPRGDVVLGGHSLGGSMTTAYATWDFGGKPGAKGLSGLVYIDGGSSPVAITPEEATEALAELQDGSPWLTFGTIEAPFAGLFNVVGSTITRVAPDEPSLLQDWPVLPGNLKPPVPANSEASYGYALDTKTSPEALAAAQAHLGRLADSGDPRGWVRDGALTPVQRFARMFSGTGILGHDGTAWYHPQRLTIDSGAVAAGNPNPAQAILDVNTTMGDELPNIPIYAFGASLGGERVLEAARILADQSGIPERKLKLVNRESSYAHNDPLSAYPRNAFVSKLIGFLKNKVG